ncbi:MAG: hypothetical protein ETSY2_27600 [Candidatus Entotheonella gemina]|uniref:MucR family transcriptional regulator n=1 Tax=Candidatus Entotheonella gemina TaxID=1429439 RepID=W4M4T9_9BACT|nr:MAG: hypothetical protein ETSY2_27600 [Candidatus Entotheonella gemina]
MPQTILEMAKDLVTEQILRNDVSSDEAQSLLIATHETLAALQRAEMTTFAQTSPESGEDSSQTDWQRSISKYAIRCLECGDSFRQLSSRHLRIHDLNSRSYRAKYGIPRTQPLSSRTATARRRELAQQIRPWEKAASERNAAKAAAKKARKS